MSIEIVNIPWEKKIESSSSPLGKLSELAMVSWNEWVDEKEGIGFTIWKRSLGRERVDEKFWSGISTISEATMDVGSVTYAKKVRHYFLY